MTFGAGLNLSSVRTVGVRRTEPGHALPVLSGTGEFDVPEPGTVTGFARSVHLGIGRREGLGRGFENLAQIR